MAPEIIDLISDDEDEEQDRVTSRDSGSKHTRPNPILRNNTTDSATSSHTECNSPTTQSPQVMNTEKGKGKARAASIPEIDLSHDPEDDGDDNNDGHSTDRGGGADPQQQHFWGEYGNAELSEDEALRQAIALSLQDQISPGEEETRGTGSALPKNNHGSAGATTASKPLPNWHSSPTKTTTASPTLATASSVKEEAPTDDADIRLEIAAPSSDTAKTDVQPAPPSNTPSFTLANLDRKQMEAERLARLKRKHGGMQQGVQEQDADPRRAKSTKISRHDHGNDFRETSTLSPPPIRRHMQNTATGDDQEGKANERKASTMSLPTRNPAGLENHSVTRAQNTSLHMSPVDNIDNDSSSSPAGLHPKGIAFKTHVQGRDDARTISFAELISPSSELESALLSSFIWDFDWLFPHFETRRTKFQLVMHAKSELERANIRKDWAGVPNVRLTFPPMEGNVNCMHSKLMLLFYKNNATSGKNDRRDTESTCRQRCRIVIPTANLVDFDWGVGGFMENTAWMIDLPPKDTSPRTAFAETKFQQSLKQFLKAQTVPEDVLLKLDEFDFTETTTYGFVHTIGGTHSGQAWKTTGLCGLGRTIAELGLATEGPIQMDYVTSSMGSLNNEFMSSMYLAAQGDDGVTEFARIAQKLNPGNRHTEWQEGFRVYFPSENTVRKSRGGAHKAGTICFSAKWWETSKFPRSNVRDCVSAREGLLMHNKVCTSRSLQHTNSYWFIRLSNLSLTCSIWIFSSCCMSAAPQAQKRGMQVGRMLGARISRKVHGK